MAEKRNTLTSNEAVESRTEQPAAVESTASTIPVDAGASIASRFSVSPVTELESPIQAIFSEAESSIAGLSLGLANLARIPKFDHFIGEPIPGTEFSHCVMGLGRDGRSLVVVGEYAEALYIPYGKFVAIVEHAHERERSSVITQNFQEADYKKGERPQIIARLNLEYSALILAVGPPGRVIRKLSEINQTFYYYIPREELTAYYLVSKFQGVNSRRLENLLNSNDACRLIDLPLNPLMPRGRNDYVGLS